MTEIASTRLASDRPSDLILSTLYEIEGPDPSLRRALMSLLVHDDPDVRAEAMRILVRRWKDEEARPAAFRLFASDPD